VSRLFTWDQGIVMETYENPRLGVPSYPTRSLR
jgi:hypothetical protein